MLRQAHLLLMDRSDGLSVSPKPFLGKRVKPDDVAPEDWFSRMGIRSAPYIWPAMEQLCSKRREFYVGGGVGGGGGEFKCQEAERFEAGGHMEFRGSEIPEFPVHLQIRLGKTPDQVAGDLFGTRSARWKRCEEEANGRVLADSVRQQARGIHAKRLNARRMPSRYHRRLVGRRCPNWT